ncbi:hypothetical protein GvMRE_I2g42 [endosymbiont GvMRE of Glomus versiforme]|nr:hypothetical protein GvMRE_I2g42 [endosymbiont GvMRE of Glomus versiforme]
MNEIINQAPPYAKTLVNSRDKTTKQLKGKVN